MMAQDTTQNGANRLIFKISLKKTNGSKIFEE